MKKTFSVFWAGCFAVCSFVNFDIASALSDFPATSETAAIPEVSGPSAEIVHQNGRIDSLPTAVPTIQRLNLPEEDWLQISTVRKHADVKAALSAEANKDKITALIFNNCGNMTDDDTPKLNMSYQTMLEDFGLQPELAKIFPITTLSNLVDLKQFPNLKSIHIYSCNEWNTLFIDGESASLEKIHVINNKHLMNISVADSFPNLKSINHNFNSKLLAVYAPERVQINLKVNPELGRTELLMRK